MSDVPDLSKIIGGANGERGELPDFEQIRRAALEQALAGALTTPDRVTRYTVHALRAINDEQGNPMILVGLPSGERLELPMSGEARDRLVDELRFRELPDAAA